MARRSWGGTLLAVLVAVGTRTTAVGAAEKSAAELLPASIVGYLEVQQPGKTLDLVLDHPLAARFQEQPEFKAALQTPQYERLTAALKRLEEQLGMPWRKAA